MNIIVIEGIKLFVGLANYLSSSVGRLISWLFYPLIAIMVLEIVARYVFGAPRIWVADTSLWLYGIIFMVGGAYALLQKKHVTADLFYRRLSPRGKAVVDIIGYLVFLFPLIILLFPISVDGVILSRETGELSLLTIWRPILWPFRAVIPVALFLMLVQGISEFLQRLVFVVNPDIQLLTAKSENAISKTGKGEML